MDLASAQASARVLAGWSAELATDIAHASHAPTPQLSIYFASAERLIVAMERELAAARAAMRSLSCVAHNPQPLRAS